MEAQRKTRRGPRLAPVTHDDPLFDTSQAAAYLGDLAPHTLENNRSQRHPERFIPYVKINGSVRYRKSALDAKLASGEVKK